MLRENGYFITASSEPNRQGNRAQWNEREGEIWVTKTDQPFWVGCIKICAEIWEVTGLRSEEILQDWLG